jgi:mannose-6-phosphate isomerase
VASPEGEELYETPIDEFRLSRYALASGTGSRPLDDRTPQILLCTAGSVRLHSADGTELLLARGESAFVPAGEQVRLTGAGTAFRATVMA